MDGIRFFVASRLPSEMLNSASGVEGRYIWPTGSLFKGCASMGEIYWHERPRSPGRHPAKVD